MDYNISKGLILKFEDLFDQLENEINAYSSSDKMWILKENISNSGGNLTTHIIGNLNHFIGAILGNTGYIRKRDIEFSIKNVSKEKLLSELQDVKTIVVSTLHKINDDAFNQTYPFEFPKKEFKPTTFEFMLHILGHLAYHIGQINYHRRLLS